MASTFASQRADFFARGFDYWNDGGAYLARTKELYNQAYLELCEEELWPFLLVTFSAAGPSPSFSANNAFHIKTVMDMVTGNYLYPVSEDDLSEYFSLFTPMAATGTATYYFVTQSNLGISGMTVFPSSTNQLNIRMYAVPAELVNDSDEPIIPQRFRRYIVEGMVRVAAQEDAPEASKAAEAERQHGLAVMRNSLLFIGGQPQPSGFSDNSLDS